MLYDVLLGGLLEWNIPFLAGFTCTAVLYVYLIKRFENIKIYHKQPLLFFLSLGLLYFIIGSPLSTITHLSFSLHMMQMSILYFMIPPLLLLGMPYRLYQQAWKIPILKRFSKFILPPKISLFIFSLLFLLYHSPVILNNVVQNTFFHNGYLLLLFILAFSMWWPITSPDPKQRFGRRRMKRYAFLSGVVLMPACLLFIVNAFIGGMNNPFASQFTAQLCAPSQASSVNLLLPAPFNTTYDQVAAGTLMLGVHKFGIMLSFRLGNKVKER
ncbi:cytochrome c oxidase assembly protein [Lentibacillus salicampi]|uniref:cytochrome c oxidase assembly protein n=1 Tax=Lentibacillus salicampi TaxID=175306 RepID=UPI0014315EC6|nr:cytochrome c oxidase assembly protein [Lentibacillus salicampi]